MNTSPINTKGLIALALAILGVLSFAAGFLMEPRKTPEPPTGLVVEP